LFDVESSLPQLVNDELSVRGSCDDKRRLVLNESVHEEVRDDAAQVNGIFVEPNSMEVAAGSRKHAAT
jgi:hypothetical protein